MMTDIVRGPVHEDHNFRCFRIMGLWSLHILREVVSAEVAQNMALMAQRAALAIGMCAEVGRKINTMLM